MFLEELEDLKDRYPDRFQLIHVLSREPQEVELLSGRLDARTARAARSTRWSRSTDVDEWFLCGPYEMVAPARAAAARPRRRLPRTSTPSSSTSRRRRRRRPPRAVEPDAAAGERGHRRCSTAAARRSTCRADGGSRARRGCCGCAPTRRTPARAASAAPAGPSSSRARSRWTSNYALEHDEVDGRLRAHLPVAPATRDGRPRLRRLTAPARSEPAAWRPKDTRRAHHGHGSQRQQSVRRCCVAWCRSTRSWEWSSPQPPAQPPYRRGHLARGRPRPTRTPTSRSRRPSAVATRWSTWRGASSPRRGLGLDLERLGVAPHPCRSRRRRRGPGSRSSCTMSSVGALHGGPGPRRWPHELADRPASRARRTARHKCRRGARPRRPRGHAVPAPRVARIRPGFVLQRHAGSAACLRNGLPGYVASRRAPPHRRCSRWTGGCSFPSMHAVRRRRRRRTGARSAAVWRVPHDRGRARDHPATRRWPPDRRSSRAQCPSAATRLCWTAACDGAQRQTLEPVAADLRRSPYALSTLDSGSQPSAENFSTAGTRPRARPGTGSP